MAAELSKYVEWNPIIQSEGENLIFRAFRPDCRPRLADIFRIQVISNAQVRSPILTLGSTTFSHVKHENIYIVAVTKSNANAAIVFEFVYRLIGLGNNILASLMKMRSRTISCLCTSCWTVG